MTTTIGADTRIDGRIEGEDDVVVHGRVDGTVVLSETLTIADGGFVSGDVEARVLVIEGAASGTLRASEVIHLASTAQVEAEIFATAIRLDAGARLKGRVEMDVEAAPPAPTRSERPKSTTSRSTPARTESSSSSSSSSSGSSTGSNGASAKAAPAASSAPSAVVDVDPDELTVKELRELLQERDLPVSGTKSELIERLRSGG